MVLNCDEDVDISVRECGQIKVAVAGWDWGTLRCRTSPKYADITFMEIIDAIYNLPLSELSSEKLESLLLEIFPAEVDICPYFRTMRCSGVDLYAYSNMHGYTEAGRIDIDFKSEDIWEFVTRNEKL